MRSVVIAVVDVIFCGDNGELRVLTERVRGAGVVLSSLSLSSSSSNNDCTGIGRLRFDAVVVGVVVVSPAPWVGSAVGCFFARGIVEKGSVLCDVSFFFLSVLVFCL